MSDMLVKVTDNSNLTLAELEKLIPVALEMVGMQAEGNAKLHLEGHVDTGLLRNSITYAIGGQSPAISAYKADNPKPNKPSSGTYSGTAPGKDDTLYIGTNVEYAIYVEKGTSKMAPVSFLRNAMSSHTEEYKKILEKVLSSIGK